MDNNKNKPSEANAANANVANADSTFNNANIDTTANTVKLEYVEISDPDFDPSTCYREYDPVLGSFKLVKIK